MLELFETIKRKRPEKGIAVDCGCMGNPGKAEFRGVDIETGEILFDIKIPGLCTNNIAEFIALVYGVNYKIKNNFKGKVYTDSRIAMNWWEKRRTRTTLNYTKETQTAHHWAAQCIKKIPPNNKGLISFWSNKEFGETPADYGRK